MNYTILLVDDEAANLRMLERLLSADYNIVTADSGQAALNIIAQQPVAMIITDQRMPGMTGIEFLKRAETMAPLTVRVIITGYTDAEALVEALNSGVVYKYITKPWINSDLKTTIQRGLQHHETLKAQRILQENYTRALAEIDEAKSALNRFSSAILQCLDPVGYTRVSRVAKLAGQIARQMDLSAAEAEELQFPLSIRALLNGCDRAGAHGNGVDEALRAATRFEAGSKILSEVPYVSKFMPTVRHLTERFDGAGYPNRLSGENIPIGSRIASVAIAYDDMVSPRYDKPKFPVGEAIQSIVNASGSKFDPVVVDAFREVLSAAENSPPQIVSRAAELRTRSFI
jgi:response regulator RpfG family c-di-GMP phosphodiesterase